MACAKKCAAKTATATKKAATATKKAATKKSEAKKTAVKTTVAKRVEAKKDVIAKEQYFLQMRHHSGRFRLSTRFRSAVSIMPRGIHPS